MKNSFFLALVALFIGISANAQSTVDSIAAKYQLIPMPAPLTTEKIFPALGVYQLNVNAEATTTSDVITASNEVTPVANVTITLDSASKGIVWVDGLPEGRFKAYLKKSPTTYRIIAQKTNLGKQIPEGTLIFDEASNTLNIALGRDFNEEDPAAVFASNAIATTEVTTAATVKSKNAKPKTKVNFYTATKVVTEPETEALGGGATNQDQQ